MRRIRRRHLVVLVSAVTLLVVAFVSVVAAVFASQTGAGREQIRVLVQKELGSRIRGRLHVGKVTGSLLTSVTIDSLEIRGEDDSLFVATGKLTVGYDPRDLMDRRLLLRNVSVEHPVIRVQQYPKGDWNHQRILRRGVSRGPSMPGRSLGDFVILDSVTVRDGSFILDRPWKPNDTLTGAARDKAVANALKDTAREYRRSGNGFTHIQRWTRMYAFLPHVRLAHPDSNQFGREFHFERGRMEEQEPPFSFRNGQGVVRHLGDSVFVDIPHFDLPASTGSAVGKVWWGSGLPQRYDIRIKGDSVSLKDIAWVYATLPRTGVGRMNLHIHNSFDNLNVMEYALTDLDVRSTKSRLIGAMTFAIGNPVLGVKDVNLRGAPINFDLVRTLAGAPLPVDWQGDLVGTVVGPGGPLTNFVVDSSQVTFRDTHVPGAVSRFTGRGELDILYPAFTKFRKFEVSTSLLDLRSIQYLYPSFMELGGTAWGSATLDSSYLDLRFAKGNFYHRNGPETPSHFTGNGRVTYGEKFMKYDLDLFADPVSVTMISRAYELGLKGNFSGPIRAKGKSDSLTVIADLTGPAGHITYDGIVDLDGLTMGVRGAGRVEKLEYSQLFDVAAMPAGWTTGDYKVDIAYDTNDVATMKGSASLAHDRSEFEGVRVFPSRVVARFDDRKIFVDTLHIESTAATLDASGALGLGADRADSVIYYVTADSLGGLRDYITKFMPPRDSTAAPDSLSGTVSVNGTVAGSVHAMRIAGVLAGTNVVLRTDAGRQIDGAFAITDPFTSPTGSMSLRSKTLKVAGMALDTLGFSMRLNEGKTGAFTLGALARNAATIALQGEFARADSTTLVSLRSGAIVVDKSQWHLAGASDVTLVGRNVSIDSLVLLNGRGGRVALSGDVPEEGRARFLFRADSLPLFDVGTLVQMSKPLSGWATITAAGAGTKFAPVFNADAVFSAVSYGGVGGMKVEHATLRGTYADDRAQVSVDMARGNATVLHADGSLPMALRYFGARLLDDSLRASIKTGEATLDIIQPLMPGLRNATGRLVANVAVSGTWSHPDVSGSVLVENGDATLDSLGIRLRGIHVDIGLFGHADSLAVRRMTAWNGASPRDSISISGHIAYRDLANPVLNLRLDARTFRVMDKRAVARLDVSTERGGLVLTGPYHASTLVGGVIIDRGVVFLPDPELLRKQSLDVRAQFVDSATLGLSVSGEEWKLLQSINLGNVRVTLGDEVSLRSPEADIRLTGALTLQRALIRVGVDGYAYRPVADGVLRADRGTYNLTLGEGVFQREFIVESGGSIVFYPSPDLYPELNISALHAVKRANNPDLRIRVRLTGPVYPNPVVSLESAESYTMSQTDMVSYLIFGVPSFALGEQEAKTNNFVAQTFAPTTQVLLGSQLNRFVSGLGAQIRPGTLNTDSLFAAGSLKNMLYTTRIAADYQLSENVFFGWSTGLCSLDPASSGSATREYLSGKLEYRFSPSTAVRASREPPTSAQTCGKTVTGRALFPTPSQWGVSLSKSWRF
jgi:translocation and assembly module TamB